MRGGQVLGLLGVLVLGWASVEQLPLWMADQRTGVGERSQVVLADGSQVQLNSNSALDVKFDDQQRVIELLKGEMWVEVAKDAQRPFVVRTDQGTATALGTRFLVQRAVDGSTVVTVIESTVAAKGNHSERKVRQPRAILAGPRPASASGRSGAPAAWPCLLRV